MELVVFYVLGNLGNENDEFGFFNLIWMVMIY